jgi:hypothetical protein
MKLTLSPVGVDLARSTGMLVLTWRGTIAKGFYFCEFRIPREQGTWDHAPTRRTTCICIMLGTLPTRSIITSEQREGIQNDSEVICLLLDRF